VIPFQGYGGMSARVCCAKGNEFVIFNACAPASRASRNPSSSGVPPVKTLLHSVECLSHYWEQESSTLKINGSILGFSLMGSSINSIYAIAIDIAVDRPTRSVALPCSR
jgi:hypothetical protein